MNRKELLKLTYMKKENEEKSALNLNITQNEK
jgi:hypothetical protein